MSKPFLDSKKQVDVYEYIKKNEPVEQAQICEVFQKQFQYKNHMSARNGVGLILRKLESNRKISKKQAENESRGAIPKNIWKTA